MGTPDFAVPSLQRLIDSKHEVCAVFSQPDKPKGRGHKMQLPPVKELAIKHNIEVFQPVTLRNEDTINIINYLKPDLIVVVAYGKILPKLILDIPPYGCINVHGSLLPKYRGAAPIQWAVINGENITGVTTMYMSEGLDNGDIIDRKEIKISENETSGELFDKLKVHGADLLIETLQKIESGNVKRTAQDDSKATLAPILSKKDAYIDWNQNAETIRNFIRGMNPWPCATSTLMGKKIKIYSAEVYNLQGNAGQVINSNGSMIVHCEDMSLKLLEIQPENGKRMNAESYLLGHNIPENTYFE